MITELNERSREIFRLIVEAYLETGDPIGSRALSKKLSMKLSPSFKTFGEKTKQKKTEGTLVHNAA